MRYASVRFSVALALVAGALWVGRAASAQGVEGAAGSARAEALFQRGRELMDAKQTAAACEAFASSQAIEPKLGTLLNLAVCHEQLGLVASAWAEFTTAATQAAREGHADREKFARDRVAELAPRLPMLTLGVTPSPGATAKLDGQPYPLTATPLPIDRGVHDLVVSAPGAAPWSKRFEVQTDGERVTVDVPALRPTSEAPGEKPVPIVRSDAPAAPSGDGWGSPTLAIVGFSVGGAGLLVGSITGGVSMSQTSDLKTKCQGGCPASAADDLSSANALANVSNVSFVLGALGLGLGVVGIAIAAPSEKIARVEPIVGPGFAGLRGSF